MSVPGTTWTSRSLLRMSVHWGEAVMPTSLPEMTRMTHLCHSTINFAVMHSSVFA
jgi:hypothetical protein